MKFTSTRNRSLEVDASYAIIKGLSDDGGLFVPTEFPQIDNDFLHEIMELSYYERAAKIIGLYLTDFSEKELLKMCKSAYEKFDSDTVAPLVKIDENRYVLELWHGRTAAFKDMALSLLPYLMVESRKKQNITDEIKVLVATSGDTGKAALEGFKDVDGTTVTVLYPSEGVSDVQKLQMRTQEGNNVYVAAVRGNFDDCQNAVKRIFSSKETAEKLKSQGVMLSSANSINFGRLVPQIVYYFSAYLDLVLDEQITMGDSVNFVVPTGNFGNILAGFYAKRMGLKIGKLICASNSNNVLTDFFLDGKYDINRDFFKTVSPSMDILISSNLERLIYELSGRNDSEVRELMGQLKTDGKYQISAFEKKTAEKDFCAGYSNEEETYAAIQDYYDELDYLFDTHTAVAASVSELFDDEASNATIIVSTASPYKFASDVLYGLTEERVDDPFLAIKRLNEETAVDIPAGINGLKGKKVRFNDEYTLDNIFNVLSK